jgi:hypothetical protein
MPPRTYSSHSGMDVHHDISRHRNGFEAQKVVMTKGILLRASIASLILASCRNGAVARGGSGGSGGEGGAPPVAGNTGSDAGRGGAGQTTGVGGQTTGGQTGGGQMTGGGGGRIDAGAPRDADPPYEVMPPPPAGRGATVPWIEYEAESASTNGVQVGPDRTFGTVASESSGRRAVRLEATGQFIELTSTQRANAIVVRTVIPDAPGGGGISATLNLYVGGTLRQALALTSKYAWSYGGEASTANDPALGGAHHFYDETRAFVGDVPPGTKVKLQKDADSTAAYYIVDLVDLEYVAPPLAQPEGFLSLAADCGATAGDGNDDGSALQTCVNAARNMGKGVWIPPGTWEMAAPLGDTTGVTISGVAVRGAGMWYSTLRGSWARFHCADNNCRFYDFAILGDTVARDDAAADNGFNGGAGTGSRLENIWVEHTKVGYWVGAGNVGNGLVITGCRFRDLFADGVNFASGTSNSEIVNSHFRNTGDDAAASWSSSATRAVNTNNIFHFNTVQLPWRANCFGIYGGQDNHIEDNLCTDVVTYPGILIAQQFTSHAFTGTTVVQRNSVVRAGGHMFNQEHGAIELFSSQGPIAGVLLKDIKIDSPTYAGLHIEGPNPITNATFDTIAIDGAGTFGILIKARSQGAGIFTNVTVSNASSGGMSYEGGATFNVGQGPGNRGW